MPTTSSGPGSLSKRRLRSALNCSKAALGKLADGLAAEHGGDGILAFDVDPGPVWTERSVTQIHRLGYPQEIFSPVEVPAAAVAWLATEAEAADYNGAHFMAQEFVRDRALQPPEPADA